MNANVKLPAITIVRDNPTSSIFTVVDREAIAIKAGTVVRVAGASYVFEQDTPIDIVDPAPGHDYGIFIAVDGTIRANMLIGSEPLPDDAIFGGFHLAPSGNAIARAGGDGIPAINPFSCWDLNFRPACPDPRGMALVDGRFWADIYLLNIDHLSDGTSRFGRIIADGRDLPKAEKGKVKKLDYATAVDIYAHHGKGLLGAEEFFAAAYGTTERVSCDAEPEVTGNVSDGRAKFVSKWGLCDVTGTMWQWGTDGDPDNPRASLFGGSWWSDSAGSRYADLVYWPGSSYDSISARGRSDHMKPVA